MKERGAIEKLDRYLRREDTLVAQTLKKVLPLEGATYRNSRAKRVSEILIGIPSSIASLPLIAALSALVKLEDGNGAFYVQERLGKEGKKVKVVKLRGMRPNSDSDTQVSIKNAVTFGAVDDPRNTRIGRLLRKYELDELPQLFQVVGGNLSLVDIRMTTDYILENIKALRPKTYEEWKKAYFEGTPGLFSLNSVVNRNRKDEKARFHHDMLYKKRASLGLDLYILFRAGAMILGKLTQKKFP